MSTLKKKLDKTPKQVYNIVKKDGEGFDLSSIPFGYSKTPDYNDTNYARVARELRLVPVLWDSYRLVKKTYEENPDLFSNPPVFAGGFFRDIVWGIAYPKDLDLFFNSYGMENAEAEDNLCLFLSKMGLSFKERDYNEYEGSMEGVFRVFDLETVRGHRCPVQAILKDMGPPEDDPLYVTKDYNYNHSKIALSVAGEPEIHIHGHAVFGWEEMCHVQFGPKGFDKCDNNFPRSRFQRLDLWKDPTVTTKPKSGVKLKTTNPCSEIPLTPADGEFIGLIERELVARELNMRPAGAGLVEAIQQAQRMRNQFIDQFDPLRNNRRPLP